MLPPARLVKANGGMEGRTIGSLSLGVLLGGQLVGRAISTMLLGFDMPRFDTGIDTPPEAAISTIVVLYTVAAVFNLYIPRTTAPLQPLSHNVVVLVRDFSNCNARLWSDKLGQNSLTPTTLFWDVSGNLRYIELAWASVSPG